MGRKATGTIYKSKGVWYVAVSLDKNKKVHAAMPWAQSEQDADLRRLIVAELAADLREAGKVHMIRNVCRKAAAASDEAVVEIARLVRGLVAGVEHEAPPTLILGRGRPEDTWTVQRLGDHWTSHRLADESGGRIRRIDQADNIYRLRKHIYPAVFDGSKIGEMNIAEFTREHADFIIGRASVPAGSKRHVGQCLKYMFRIAAEHLELLPASPLQGWKLPLKQVEQDGAFIFPEEDAQLMACLDVPLVRRLFFGAATREGIRRGRLNTLPWDRTRLTGHGRCGTATVPGKPNKKAVNWVLQEGTAEALRRWSRICPSTKWVFPAEAVPRYRRSRAGLPMYVGHYAEDLRAALLKAGVTRRELFDPVEGFTRLVGHDLRATFVTLARARGESDSVIKRRTRHTTTAMIDRYDHAVGMYAELSVEPLLPLHEAIPELAEMDPSDEWVEDDG